MIAIYFLSLSISKYWTILIIHIHLLISFLLNNKFNNDELLLCRPQPKSLCEYGRIQYSPKLEIIWFHSSENPGSSAVDVNCINSNKKYSFVVYSEENYGHVCVHIIPCFNMSWISTTLSILLEMFILSNLNIRCLCLGLLPRMKLKSELCVWQVALKFKSLAGEFLECILSFWNVAQSKVSVAVPNKFRMSWVKNCPRTNLAIYPFWLSQFILFFSCSVLLKKT